METLNVKSSASAIGDVIKLSTRTQKQMIDRPALFLEWGQQLDHLGLSKKKSNTLRDDQPTIEPRPLPLSSILQKVVEKRSVFRLQDLYANVAIEAQWQHANLQTIESTVQYLIDRKDVISLGVEASSNHLFSTPAMIAKEKKLAQIADELQLLSEYRLSEKIINSAIKQQNSLQGFSLSDEQSEGVFSACQSGLDILQGAAGAGKSTSMQAVRIAYESAGFNVIGATVARQAAIQLESETGIVSGTLAKLLNDLEREHLELKNTVLVVDEAGQLSSLDLLQLMEAVQCAGGKLILVGEQQQLDAINHSGSLRYLSQRQGCARIETIRRQREQWGREAVMNLRAGNAKNALEAHQQRGLLHFSENGVETRKELVQQWAKFQQDFPEKESMILAQRWRDVKPLNDSIRQIYQSQGQVGQENIEVDCVIGNHIMQFHFSKGERVRFTRNDYRRNFTNGELGTIEKIEKQDTDIQFTVRCDDKRVVTFSLSDYSDANGSLYLAQAYATTVYASQGSTIDGDVFVHYTSGMDRSASYVAGSRHKDNCHWFVNREEIDVLSGAIDSGMVVSDEQRMETLARRMSSNRTHFLAIEYLEEKAIRETYRASEKYVPKQKMELVAG